MQKHLVIAYFLENLDWLYKVKVNKTYCYHKSRSTPAFPNIENIKLPNIGQESIAYCKYIVDHYEDLPELTIFCQGYPFDHSPNFLNIIVHNSIADMQREVNKVYQNQYKHSGIAFFSKTWLENIYQNQWRLSTVEGIWKILFTEPMPQQLVSYWGAIFCVERRLITKTSRLMWQRLLELHYQESKTPFALEHLWHYIFTYEPDLKIL